MHPGEILRDAPVAHLRMSPQPLDHQLRVLTDGADPGEAPVARLSSGITSAAVRTPANWRIVIES